MWTSLLLTAKWTSAPLGKLSSGSTPLSLRSRVAVEAILVDGVLDALGEIGLQLSGSHRQAVEEQHEVDAVLVRQRVADLPHHAQPVGGVASDDVGVHRHRRLELSQRNRLAQPDQLDAVAQHVERAAIVELLADAVEQHASAHLRRGSSQASPMRWVVSPAPRRPDRTETGRERGRREPHRLQHGASHARRDGRKSRPRS